MNTMKSLIVISMGILLAACGGGGDGDGDSSSSGYSGKTSAATVDDSNNTAVAKGVHVASKQAVSTEEGGGALRSLFVPDSPRDILIEQSLSDSQSLLARNTTSGDYSQFCNGGGSASYTLTTSQNGESGEFTYNYNNCTYTYGEYSITYDGSMYYEYDNNGNYWLWEYDLTVSTNYMGSYTLTSSYECSGDLGLGSCTVSENFSDDGVSYRVTDVSFSSSGSDFDFTAKIYHEDYGYVEIVATDLVLCDNGGFSSGSIVVTDSSSTDVLTLTYSGCDAPVVVTYNGTTFNMNQ